MIRYTGVIARTEREVAEAQRVRWRVYGEEEAMLAASGCVDGREVDPPNRRADTIHFIVRAGEEAVGTVRLLPRRQAGWRARPGLLADASGSTSKRSSI